MKIFTFLSLLMLSGCSWFHAKPKPAPVPPQFVVTGAPAGSIVFIDGVMTGRLTELNDRPQIVAVTAGTHTVEVRIGDTVVYREDAYIKSGEKRVITVLSGSNRE